MNEIKIPVPEALKALNGLIGGDIFLVGGYVRDCLAGYVPRDIDVAGDVDVKILADKLRNTEFAVADINPELMTAKIRYGEAVFEFTSFRTDVYGKEHRPEKVERVSDVGQDAMRRDFKMNAVYCRISDGKILDPVGGLGDVRDRVVSAIGAETLKFDGVRLLRMCRQAAELGFGISPETMKEAVRNVGLIDALSPCRIREEFDRILSADAAYGVPLAHKNGILLLDEAGILEKILPEITLGKGLPQRADFHRYDVFGHITEAFAFSDGSIRLAALLHDVGKAKCYLENGDYHAHEVIGTELAEKIMLRFGYPKSAIREVKTLVSTHMYDLKCEASENKVRQFIVKYADFLDKIILLKQADYCGCGIRTGLCPTAEKLKRIRRKMKAEDAPFSIGDLKVDGGDIRALGAKESDVGVILERILKEAILANSVCRTREEQLKSAERLKRDLERQRAKR